MVTKDSLAEIIENPNMLMKKTLTLGVYFFLWYFFTVVYNVSNKRVLNELPLPATVAIIQIILGIPVFLPAFILKPPNYESYRFILPILCKISFLHALGSLATVVSLSQGTVSFTHIIKAAEPIFTAVFSAFILGSVFPISVYLTLIPIVLGVGLASVKELSFSWLGFVAGMSSNFFYQLRIVYSKKELSGDNNTLSPANLFRLVTIISAIELLPISAFLEGYKVRKVWDDSIVRGMDSNEVIMNLLISGFSYYCYNEISFWILGSISPITHAVGNTIKRVIIIFASILILKSPITNHGILGSAIAIFGTLMYSLAMNNTSFIDKEKKSIRV
jgi:solute carrier family 35 protein E1